MCSVASMDNGTPSTPQKQLRIGVIGGGTAGHFAALAIKQRHPNVSVTLVESSTIPIIGVGEATTTLMPPFLHNQLGLDIVELFETVKPTFKMGIKFEWGLPGDYYFTYPFGEAFPIEAYCHDGDLRKQSLVSQLMGASKGPVLKNPNDEVLSLLPSLKFAYHLNNAPFVGYLAKATAKRGIEHIDMTIAQVIKKHDGSIEKIISDTGQELSFDLYIDASGFRSYLLEQILEVPFISYATSLFCDRAIVATVPQKGTIEPFTTAETMDCGWCWRIPVEGEDHRGYVHSSSFISVDEATNEMRQKNPGMGEPWVVNFRSGRHQDFWSKNVVAIGNSYGFVEPLESTALHMIILEVAYLCEGIADMLEQKDMSKFASFASESVGAHWDYLRWFLSIHHKFNRRLDTEFWQASRAEVNTSGFEHILAKYKENGPWLIEAGQRFEVGDPAFGYSGLMMMLLGQKVPAPPPEVSMSKEAWQQLVAKNNGIAAMAMNQDEVLKTLRQTPQMLQSFVTAPNSWCRGDKERFAVTRTY